MRKTKFKWYYIKKGKKHLTKKAKMHLSKRMKEYWKIWELKVKKIKLYRFSYAINFPLHKKYYGCIGQIWSKNRDRDKEDFLRENVKKFLEKCLGYTAKEWWFDMALEGEGWQTVLETNKFINYWEKRYENDKGITIKKDSGYYKIS